MYECTVRVRRCTKVPYTSSTKNLSREGGGLRLIILINRLRFLMDSWRRSARSIRIVSGMFAFVEMLFLRTLGCMGNGSGEDEMCGSLSATGTEDACAPWDERVR